VEKIEGHVNNGWLRKKALHPFEKIATEVPLHTNFGGEVLPSEYATRNGNKQTDKQASKKTSKTPVTTMLSPNQKNIVEHQQLLFLVN